VVIVSEASSMPATLGVIPDDSDPQSSRNPAGEEPSVSGARPAADRSVGVLHAGVHDLTGSGPATGRCRWSPTTWPDFAALVEANNGVWGGCWCMGFHPRA